MERRGGAAGAETDHDERIYTGADGLTHSEKIEMKLTPNGRPA